MPALLAANPYLGIEDANLQHVYWFAGAIGVLALCLLVFRLVGMIFTAQREQKASWNTFRQLAKTRGLKPVQIEVLMILTREAKIKRPPKILGSIQMFDKAVQKAQENYEFSEKQLILVDSIRKKLVSSKVRWTPSSAEERRQLERARCSWNARMLHITKAAVDKEMLKTTGDGDERFRAAVSELTSAAAAGGKTDDKLTEHKVQIRDISAGGVALLASQNFRGAEGDFGLLFGESQRIPFAMENLCGEIRSIEEDQDRGCLVLHFRFLTLEAELRKGIIQYVYEKQQSPKSQKSASETAPSAEGVS